MALINWNNTYEVNVVEFDQQHKKLVDLINQLHDAMKEGKGNQAAEKVLDELITYTRTHFATEERLFRLYGYPEAENHRKVHESFTQTVSRMKQEYSSGKTALSIQLSQFLKDWLIKHICQTDKNYSSFFKQKGVA